MNQSIKKELRAHLIETIINIADDETDFSELHHTAFNEDYYIIGHYQASEWLKKHNVDAFDAIAYVIESQLREFDEANLNLEDINSERIVNLLVYFAGYDVMPNCYSNNITKDDLLDTLKRKAIA
jgi:hypothetical protein